MSVTNAKLDREALAAWYARRHLDTDPGVEAIHFLQKNSPANEVRFLEVNNLISETTQPEPIDFGVDVGSIDGSILLVLDVTPRQWQAIENGELEQFHDSCSVASK